LIDTILPEDGEVVDELAKQGDFLWGFRVR
jgi:hypothetical protein